MCAQRSAQNLPSYSHVREFTRWIERSFRPRLCVVVRLIEGVYLGGVGQEDWRLAIGRWKLWSRDRDGTVKDRTIVDFLFNDLGVVIRGVPDLHSVESKILVKFDEFGAANHCQCNNLRFEFA